MTSKTPLKRKMFTVTENDSSDDDFMPTPNKFSRKKGIKLINVEWRIELAKRLSKTIGMKFDSSLKPLPKDDNSSLFFTRQIVNDGNSLYRSISYLIFENEDFYHRHIREAVIKNMLSNKEIYDKDCCIYTTYGSVESYIRETRVDSFGRQNKGFLELQSLANTFNTPVYLFT